MKLSEFKIKNFRSIVDSGWHAVSPDNITALIGQNESGKTSVLEALYNYYEGSISEDVLRGDLSMPEVSCAYSQFNDEKFEFLEKNRIPGGVLDAIRKNNKIVITRKWYSGLSSRVFLSGENVSEIFDELESRESKLTGNATGQIEGLLVECGEIRDQIVKGEEKLASLTGELEKKGKRQAVLRNIISHFTGTSKKESTDLNPDITEREIQMLEESIGKEKEKLNEYKNKLADRELLRSEGEKCLELIGSLELLKPELENAYKELTGVEENIKILKGAKEIKAGEARLFKAKEKYIGISRQMESVGEQTGLKIRLIKNLFGEMELAEAESEAKQEYEKDKSLYSREEAGELFIMNVPKHEFFEDFSSLLPNRIDLEDLFENNTRVEGYKAVRNFLTIAGLDPGFFRHDNNRILKQKIENLNNEVTIDFQEYWRQNFGRSNKIRIHFEMEHYDNTHPEKKGRPYLEFWVKDQYERLYPNQRSRGVRWFLSFYLELKAFARENTNRQRVLLIDEPGLSLHARAQEDVLKVFEDIKGNIQIIYTTHSPHLIDHGKLHRLLAVQRTDRNNEQSETIIFDAANLNSAASDTLSPISSLMGTGLTGQGFIRERKNVIVEDITSFYYLSAIHKLVRNSEKLCFLPANGPAGVTTLVNLLIGWGIEFSVLLFDNEENTGTINEINTRLQNFNSNDPDSKLQFTENIAGPEDLFSTLDFKKFIIKKRIGISGSNSEFIRQNEISRPLLAIDFTQTVKNDNITIDDFDEETRANMEGLFSSPGQKVMTWDETL